MNSELKIHLKKAKRWLSSQPVPAPQSDAWYALSNFKQFIASVEAQSNGIGIERTVPALRHHIFDQFELRMANHCIKTVRFAHSTAEALRTYAAFYANR